MRWINLKNETDEYTFHKLHLACAVCVCVCVCVFVQSMCVCVCVCVCRVCVCSLCVRADEMMKVHPGFTFCTFVE